MENLNNVIPSSNRQMLTDEKIKSFEKEEYEVYDRNMRLWGVENQKKLSNSRVMLLNLTSSVTELAKNLILSGVNVYLYDKNKKKKNIKVKDGDINSNFFLSKADLGKERIKVLIAKLSEINNFILVKESENFDKVEEYTSIIHGFSSFKEMSEVEEICHKKNVPYYSLISCGLYGFVYTNLWEFSFEKKALKQAQSFSKQVDQFISNIKNAKSNKKILNKNCLFISLCLIDLYHRHHIISFNFEKVYLYVKDYLVYHKIEFLLENQEFMTIMKKLINNFCKEFNPVCSALGGVLSQEIIKLITLTEEPKNSFYIYDAEKQQGLFLNPLA